MTVDLTPSQKKVILAVNAAIDSGKNKTELQCRITTSECHLLFDLGISTSYSTVSQKLTAYPTPQYIENYKKGLA